MNIKLKRGIWYLVLFGVIFSYFSFLQLPQVLPDPDSFYHARIGQILAGGKIQENFPYLKFTTLNDGYIDHHFLYHILLAPFVKLMDPLQGVKIVQALISSLFVLLIYWFLKKEKIKYSLLWILILALNSPFIFRVLLIKANSLSLIFLLLGLYFIFNKKYWPLFAISYFYVLAYGGWPLMLIMVIVYVISKSLENIFFGSKSKNKIEKLINKISPFKKEKFLVAEGSNIFFASVNGIFLGVFLNPYFPKNLSFYYQQIVQIGIVNYGDKVNVGGEWSSYPFWELINSSGIVSIFLFLSLILFFISFKKQNAKSLTLFFLTAIFLLATLKSRRYVEYLIPFAVIFSAFSLNYFLKDKFFIEIKKIFWTFYVKFKVLFFILASVLIWGFIFISFDSVLEVKRDLSLGSSFNYYKGAGEYLKNNSKPGSIVFHCDWDDFPPLFYHSPENYYIVGLDPTFMYNYDEELYKEYENITMGLDRHDLYNKILYDFNASYVFLDIDHLSFNDNIISNRNFELVYRDDETFIYKVK
jgi:hypothetical protein